MKALKLFLSVILFCAAATAQTTFASLTGAVTDPSGMAVIGAQVEIVNVETGYRYTTKSNEAGLYTFSQLREGSYRLTVSLTGFKEFVAKDIGLVALDARRIDARLELGAVSTKVEVTASGPALIETEMPRVSDTLEAFTLAFMPTDSRNLTHFIPLVPGAYQDTSGFRSFSGSLMHQNDSSMDGVSMGNGDSGGQIGPLTNYIESFQEVHVDLANNSAEFGTIGQVTVVSKSGTNKLHGSLFDYYDSPWFRARSYYANARSAGVDHTPGLSVGGPVFLPKIYNGHDKTFFFYSMETSRGNVSQTTLTPSVPLAAWRKGDFSGQGTTIVDPFNNRTPFPGNQLPASRISPVSQKLQDLFYPLPNFGNQNLFATKNYRETVLYPHTPDTYFTVRLDHRISDKSSIYGRMSWYNMLQQKYDNSLSLIGRDWTKRDDRSSNVSYSYSFSPHLFNEIRGGFAWNNEPRHGPQMGKQMVDQLGLVGLIDNLPDIPGIPNVSFSNLSLTGITQLATRIPGYKNFPLQFTDHLSWFHGRHAFKGGFNSVRVEYEDGQQNSNLFGNMSFSNRFTGQTYSDFLLGIPTTMSRAYPSLIIDRVRWSLGFFFTDEFKVSAHLTLNLGARYDLNTNWRETHGYQSIFDFTSGDVVVPNGALKRVDPLMPLNYLKVVQASQVGMPSSLLQTDKNNIAPRIGLAWRPWSNHTVLRTGFGVYYDVLPGDITTGGVPFVVNEPSYTNPTTGPTVVFPRVFPAQGTGGPSTVTLPKDFNPNLRVPYSMQYSFTIEHERWNTGFHASYIGLGERQDIWAQNVNQRPVDARLYIQKVNEAMYPQYTAITYHSNGIGQEYNSLVVGAKRRFSHGLYYELNWIWARELGYQTDPENSLDMRRERGPVSYIPTHRITGNFIYALPFGRHAHYFPNASRWLDGLIGGWHLSGIYAVYSGQFLTPQWTGPDPVGTANTTSSTPANVTNLPNILHNPNLPKSQRTVDRYFDVTAFGPFTPGHFGTASNGCIKGPGSQAWNSGLYKQITIHERALLRLELTGTNIFNHPNWSNPGVTITSTGSAGVISDMSGTSASDSTGQRSMRMGVRLEW